MLRLARLLPLILLLSACADGLGGASVAKFALPVSPGGRLCMAQCREAFDHGEGGCRLEQRGCTNDMQAQAIRDYEQYVQEQFKAKAPLELHPSDFERPELCAPDLCLESCRTVFVTCFEKCGGKVNHWTPSKRLPFER